MVRFGVRRAQTLGVSTFSLPTQNPHPYPETTTSFPHSSPCYFVLLLRSLFKSSFVKHKRLLSSVEPDWVQTAARKLPLWREGSQERRSAQGPGLNVGNLRRHSIVCVAKPIVVLSQQGAWRAPVGHWKLKRSLQPQKHNGGTLEWVPGNQWKFHSCGRSKWGVAEDDEYLSLKTRRSVVAAEWHADIHLRAQIGCVIVRDTPCKLILSCCPERSAAEQERRRCVWQM